MVSSNWEYRLSPTVRMSADRAQGVLLDLARGKFYGLTAAAVEIAQALVHGTNFATLLELLQAKFDAPREVLEQDLARFLEELERAKLCDSS